MHSRSLIFQDFFDLRVCSTVSGPEIFGVKHWYFCFRLIPVGNVCSFFEIWIDNKFWQKSRQKASFFFVRHFPKETASDSASQGIQ